jgi:hypothetical protein
VSVEAASDAWPASALGAGKGLQNALALRESLTVDGGGDVHTGLGDNAVSHGGSLLGPELRCRRHRKCVVAYGCGVKRRAGREVVLVDA